MGREKLPSINLTKLLNAFPFNRFETAEIFSNLHDRTID